MILAVDVGNSHIVIGVLQEGGPVFSARCATDRGKTEDEYAFLFQDMFDIRGISVWDLEGGILSTVVPSLRQPIVDAVERVTGKRMRVVSADMDLGMALRVSEPRRLGTDRIVDAVAARSLYPPPLVVVDMGTASTFSVLDKAGDFIGGMIVPGLRLSVDALSARAAQLPHIDFAPPETLIGADTEACMRSGAVYGTASMVDGMVDRVERELGAPVTAVLTGGLAPSVAPFCRREVHLHPDLLLRGLQILYDRDRKR